MSDVTGDMEVNLISVPGFPNIPLDYRRQFVFIFYFIYQIYLPFCGWAYRASVACLALSVTLAVA